MARMIRRHVVVHGFVQGVGYRWTCQYKAREMGVRGWVRNCDDGTVEAVFEGDDVAVAAMVAWVNSGPRAARVTRVDVRAENPRGEKAFEVVF